jgi:anti-sigma-K factor RskA
MSPTRMHDRIEELVAVDVLDGLDEAGRLELAREMASHGPDCAECALLVAEYADAAASLALALEPVAVSPGAEDRLMAAAREWTRGVQEGSVAVLEPVRGRRVRPLRRTGVRIKGWVVAAAAAVVVVVAGSIGYVLAPNAQPPQTVAFSATGSQRLAVVFVPGSRQAVLVGSNMDAPPAGKVYELWYIASKDADPTPAGTFRPDANGSVLMNTTVGERFVAVAVSVEPPGGSTTPTKVILVQNV